MTTRPYLSFIHEAGRNIGYTFEPIMEDWIYRVTHGNKSFLMHDLDLGLNYTNAAKIIESKSATYASLYAKGIPAVEHHFLMNPNNPYHDISKGDLQQIACDLFYKYGEKCVLKQDTGSAGKDVYLINNKAELNARLDELFERNLNCSIGPYYHSEFEYRVIMLNNEPELVFAKEKVSSWKHNLTGRGAKVNENISENIKQELFNLAKKASKNLGTNFVSVDILDNKDGLKILEVNGTVSLNMYLQGNIDRRKKALSVFEKAFKLKLEKH